VSKTEVKTNFRGASRLSGGTGIVERLEIVDVGCNLKQFDGLTGRRTDSDPDILRHIYAAAKKSTRSGVPYNLMTVYQIWRLSMSSFLTYCAKNTGRI